MMISETKSILSFPDLIARQLIRIHFTCFTVFVQFILGPLGRVALSPTAQMIEAEFSSLYASNRLDILTIKAGSNYIKGKGTVRTDRPKTKASNREIVLPKSVLKILEKWKARQAADKLKAGDAWPDHDALFTNTIGNRLYLNNVTGKWRKIQKAYDLKDAPLYSLRHTGASLLIESGCSIEEVSRRLGHSRASTTLDIYTHLFEKASQHTTNVMTDAIAKARKKKKAK